MTATSRFLLGRPGVFLLATLMLALGGCGRKDDAGGQESAKAAKAASAPEAGQGEGAGLSLSPEEISRAGIKLEKVALQAVGGAVTVTATIRANQDRMARIAPRVEGRITALPANLGDRVKAGQVLAVLDSLAVGEASAALLQAQASSRVADADFKRASELNAEEIIPQKEFLRARSEAEKATAGLRAAEDRLRLLGVAPRQLGERVVSSFPVTAPFAGTIVDKKVTLGSLATPNDAIFMLADLSTVWIEASLNETLLAQVQVGAKARVTLDAYPGEVFTGQVTYVSSLLDKDSRTVQARIEVANKDGRLKPEMFASASIDSSASGKGERPREAISVPDNAIVLLQGQPTVFVVSGKGFDSRAILPGDKLAGRTVVKSGLSAGESVVAEGAYALKARLLKSQIGDEH